MSSRGDQPYRSVDDLWRRAGIPSAALVELAEADAFRSALGLARREALWANEPLPLFAAIAAREHAALPEQAEPAVALRPMTAGGEVVEDYGHLGLTLREHPVSFLRQDFSRRRILTCAEAVAARDRRRIDVAGLVLVRQRPGSAKGVMFMTIEDETGVANVVIWQKVFETFRRTVLGAGMIGIRGYIQREGEVVHVIACELFDLSRELASVGSRDAAFWVALLGPGGCLPGYGKANYDMTIWRAGVFRAFPRAWLSRKAAHAPLDYLRTFRNRIAHHEPIFDRHLAADYASLLQVADWISVETQDWIVHHSRVLVVLSQPLDDLGLLF